MKIELNIAWLFGCILGAGVIAICLLAAFPPAERGVVPDRGAVWWTKDGSVCTSWPRGKITCMSEPPEGSSP